jgi:PAS domain S-box-containing protein
LLVVAATLASYVLASELDVFETFATWANRHEKYNLDEIAVATVVGFLALSVYSWRRYQQADAERRQLASTKRTLADTTQRYRSLFDYSPNAVFSVDPLGRFVASNAASARLSGYSVTELQSLEIGALILASRAVETGAAFEQSLRREPQQVDTALTHKDGHVVELSVTGVPIIVDDEVVGVYCIGEDITERKQLERELWGSQLAAERANDDKSLFLANVSHEIRTPLTTMLGTTELLMDTPLDPLQEKFLATINRSGERLLALVNDILDFSNLEAGMARADEVEVDVRAVVMEVAGRFRTAAQRQGLDYQVAVDASVPPVLTGDPARLARVLTNLLDNAVKFTDQGWVHTSVRVAGAVHGRVDVQLLVEDSGIGMTHEHQGRLFDSFSQADASITRKYAGTGLGLGLCKQLVTLMRGSISVESSPAGSAFSVVLPLAVAPQAARSAHLRVP